MRWFLTFWNSSIGKKMVMALTGILLIIFLKIHLIGNLFLFVGADAFNTYAGTLEHVKPIVRVIEVILALIVFLHILNGVNLWFLNRKARPIGYKVDGSSKNSTIFSRTMIVSGSVIFIFLVIHLQTFWYVYNFSGTDLTLYEVVVDWFAKAWYSVLYIIAMILLGFHLNHGFQSAFQTFGWNHSKYNSLIKFIGSAYAIIVSLAFASIPFYFLFFGGNV